MKLLLHNMLQSHVKGVTAEDGFPLVVEPSAGGVEETPCDVDLAFLIRQVPRLDWPALRAGAAALEAAPGCVGLAGLGSDLPETAPEPWELVEGGSPPGPGDDGSGGNGDGDAAMGGPPSHNDGDDDTSDSSDDDREPTAVARAVHRALLEVQLLEGDLVCPSTGRRFPVRRGVPNMKLREDEVA